MTKLFRKELYNKEQDFKDKLNLPVELDDFKQVLIQAARSGKYKPNNWLERDGGKQDKESQYKSIMHHIVEAIRGSKEDRDSGLDPRLHAACRLMMDYTRDKRGIVHSIDAKLAIHNNIGKLVSHTTPFMQNHLKKTKDIAYFNGDAQITKEEYEDIIVTKARLYLDFNKGID